MDAGADCAVDDPKQAGRARRCEGQPARRQTVGHAAGVGYPARTQPPRGTVYRRDMRSKELLTGPPPRRWSSRCQYLGFRHWNASVAVPAAESIVCQHVSVTSTDAPRSIANRMRARACLRALAQAGLVALAEEMTSLA